MSLLQHICDNIRASLNALLDNKEDPVRLLNKYLQHMQNDIADVERALAKQITTVKRLKLNCDEAFVIISKKEVQALEALKKGREDLARKALEEKKLHLAFAEENLVWYTSSKNAAESLRCQLVEMKAEYDRLQMKRDSLAARYRAAQLPEDNPCETDDSKDQTIPCIERLEEKIQQMEDRIKHAEPDSIDKSDIDREIEELKQTLKMNQ